MNDLLSFVLDANGGLDRWEKASMLTAHVSVGGAFWGRKGWPGLLGRETVTLDTRREHIELTPLGGPGRRSVFDTGPERLAILADDGTVIGKRDDPRASFAGFDRTTSWDLLQTTYFISYAMWNYLTSPFLLTYPGVQTREIEPWQENGQTWRALAITFPDAVATHSTEQIFYFDATGKQQRLDYQPAVNGNIPVAQYTDNHQTFDALCSPPGGASTGAMPTGRLTRARPASPSTWTASLWPRAPSRSPSGPCHARRHPPTPATASASGYTTSEAGRSINSPPHLTRLHQRTST